MNVSRRLPLLLVAILAFFCPGCTQLLGPLLSLPRTLLSLPARAMSFGENAPPPEIRALDYGMVGVQEPPRYPIAQPSFTRAVASQSAPPGRSPQG